MPAELSTQAVQMVVAGAIVAAVAVPLGLLAWGLARSRSAWIFQSWKPWRVPWGGFEVFLAFIVVFTIASALEQTQLPQMTRGIVALPIQIAFLAISARLLFPRWKSDETRTRGFRVLAGGVLAWAVLTPLVLLFHAAVLQAFTAFNWQPDEHPLVKFGTGSVLEQVLFMVQACLVAPLIEEIMFRGVLLSWAIGARDRSPGLGAVPPIAPAAFRPWLVMGMAVLFAALSAKVGPGPVVFAGVLATGLAIVWVTVRHGKRHVRAVYASAAMFAMVHASVWPSPVPLFLLGLGLGWCAVRTRGVLVPAIVHGLFNAVSAVYVLRGGT